MAGGVANERGHRFDAVFVEDAVKEFFTLGERFVPRYFSPGFTIADHGHANAIGIFVETAKRCALWADEALRPHIVMIGTDDLHMVVCIEVHLKTAHAFTQRALA